MNPDPNILPQGAPVVPTASDIYYKLGGLEGKLDAHHEALVRDQLSTAKRLDGYGTRIDTLEKSSARTAGMMLLATPIIAGVISFAVSYLKAAFT